MKSTQQQPWEWYREPDGQAVDARLHLLDRQMLDREDVPVSTVDDIELSGITMGEPINHQEPPYVSAILVGASILPRIFGGGIPRSRWDRIEWNHVTRLGTVITLDDQADELDAGWLERWICDRLIARIPGGSHVPE